MRKVIIGIAVGCGLAAAVAPALACSYNTQASSDRKPPQQTASAQDSSSQDSSTTKSQ